MVTGEVVEDCNERVAAERQRGAYAGTWRLNPIRPRRDRLAPALHLFRNFVMKQSSHNNQIS